jgi:hypothetical protein
METGWGERKMAKSNYPLGEWLTTGPYRIDKNVDRDVKTNQQSRNENSTAMGKESPDFFGAAQS